MNPAWQGASLRDAGSAYRLSRCVLLAHEDKIFQECFGCINEHSVGRNTLATVIAGLVCAADFAKERAETSTSDFILEYAAWLELGRRFSATLRPDQPNQCKATWPGALPSRRRLLRASRAGIPALRGQSRPKPP